ncbi:MAG: type II secretion system GspH family protein [Kiritimatiellaeota bacterium]|nr:type II secretion system GspH family protein [Kiritimatiellota bacterium]
MNRTGLPNRFESIRIDPGGIRRHATALGGTPPSTLHPPPFSLGFTIFELLAVLTIISIALTVILGSYTSWAVIQALDGTARTLEAGLLKARATAKAQSTYVKFFYETAQLSPDSTKQGSGYQLFVCTNDTDRAIITEMLEQCASYDCLGAGDIMDEESVFSKQFFPMPLQRLTGHVELGYVKETETSAINTSGFDPSSRGGLIIFCPDGSVWGWSDRSEHNIVISSRKRFTRPNDTSRPLRRVLRVNLATGMATTIDAKYLQSGQ